MCIKNPRGHNICCCECKSGRYHSDVYQGVRFARAVVITVHTNDVHHGTSGLYVKPLCVCLLSSKVLVQRTRSFLEGCFVLLDI